MIVGLNGRLSSSGNDGPPYLGALNTDTDTIATGPFPMFGYDSSNDPHNIDPSYDAA
jgi:hypothetical protein